MKWIFGIDKPLFRCQEVTHIRHRLRLRLGDKIVDRLRKTIFISESHADAPPGLSPQSVRPPSVGGRSSSADRDRTLGFGGPRLHSLGILQEQLGIQVHREHIPGNSNCYWAIIGCQRFFDIANGVGDQEFHAIRLRLPRL